MHEERNGRPGRRYDDMTEQEKAEEAIDRLWDEMGIVENVFKYQSPVVTDEMVQSFIEVSRDENAGYTCWTDAVRAALEAALPSGVRVKPLQWTVSEVFGARKVRGSGPFGEWCAFTLDRLTDKEIAEKKDKYQALYESRILAAIEPTQAPVVAVSDEMESRGVRALLEAVYSRAAAIHPEATMTGWDFNMLVRHVLESALHPEREG